MALKEKLTHQDLVLIEVLRHPVLFQEFLRNVDRYEDEEKLELTYYQKEFICDFNNYVSWVAARSVGKTFAITGLMLWLLINKIFPESSVLYLVPNKVHLRPVWDELLRLLRGNSFLKHFVSPNEGVNSSEFIIRLKNNTTLMCRIAGTGGVGANVMGLHNPFEIVDESALLPWKTWVELQPTLNTSTKGHRMIVSGVPIGLRDKNVLYEVDQVSDLYSKHRTIALENPRYSEKDHIRDLQQYGGEESDDYQRNVLGKHGTPTFSIFDRALMQISQYTVNNLSINGLEVKDNIAEYLHRLSFLPIPDHNRQTIMGVDFGYTQPSAIVILQKSTDGQFKFLVRIKLTKVPYPIQAKIIDYLDSKYSPIIIGLDNGSAGIAEVQRMQFDEAYKHKHYIERAVPIDFNSAISMGFDNDGNEIKKPMKEFTITLLQEYTNSHRIVYSSTDLEMVSELERMTFMRQTSGNIIYKTLTPGGGKLGEDHFTSALLCAVMAYYMKNEMVGLNPKPKKLLSPRWA